MRLGQKSRVVMLAVSLTLALGSAAFTQGEAPRAVFDNPIAGFSVTIPEDWDMGTGALGDTVMTVNTRTPSLLAPSLSFFYMRTSPKEGAEQVAGFLRGIGQALRVNVAPQVRATGKSDEWEVTMTTSVPLVGELTGRWLCRRQEGATYVIGMIGTSQAAEKFKDDVDTAFNTCHLINRQAIRYFREPTENGYRLMLPEGWKWEGSIYRDVNCPGWFVIKVRSPDGLTGCFESPPIQATTDYIGAQSLAESTFLQKLRKEVPDLELEAVHDMPRAGEVLAHAIQTAVASPMPLRAERANLRSFKVANGH